MTCIGPGRAAGNLQQQLRGALHGALLVDGIHAALETLAGVRHQAIATAAAGDGRRREERGFEQDVGGVGACRRCARRP